MIESFTPLGEGTFGSVYKAVNPYDNVKQIHLFSLANFQNSFVAIKIFKQCYNRYLVLNEITILRDLDHPNIIQFFKAYQYKGCIAAALEYVDGITLKTLIKNQKLSETVIATIAYKVKIRSNDANICIACNCFVLFE